MGGSFPPAADGRRRCDRRNESQGITVGQVTSHQLDRACSRLATVRDTGHGPVENASLARTFLA